MVKRQRARTAKTPSSAGEDQRGAALRSVTVGLIAGAASASVAILRRRNRAPAAEVRSRSGLGGPDKPRRATVSAGSYEPPRFNSALDALRSGIVVVDAGGTVTYANLTAENLGLIDEDKLSFLALRALVAQVRRSGRVRDTELEVAAPEMGDPIAVRARITPLPDEAAVIELTDISELHRVEAVRRDFVANVSHELKTPVGALQVLAEALQEATADPDAAERFAARIQKEATRIGHLVQDLLVLSRLQGAEPLPAPQPVAVDRLISDAFDQCRVLAEDKGIRLQRDGLEGIEVTGSESQLVTAVKNLVHNAISYSPEETTVTVRVGVAVPQNQVAKARTICISVADEGIGIAQENLDRIFERFYRVDSARSRATGGTGLGLAIVKHIAVNHGGRIEVSSMPEVGTTFTLMLPERTVNADRSSPTADEINTSEKSAGPTKEG
ncbi:sensor histidine kinase [Natronoglycomyces albus]|uniref:Sensor-like histidine kinase SenX3 n=1 Tax=Natronoglycomyces albus TaxID=2811108 RepID=A0A895XK32_9ACTN|nr:ATP-binding protein [Natronoglycomyces albus]QSB05694.1 two-component sensor histidine kinase [Natronoglycomyces albus]